MKLAPFSLFEAMELASDFDYLKQYKTDIYGDTFLIHDIIVVPFGESEQDEVKRKIRRAFNPTGFLQPSYDDVMRYIMTIPYEQYDVCILATRKEGKNYFLSFIPLQTFISDNGETNQGFDLVLNPGKEV